MPARRTGRTPDPTTDDALLAQPADLAAGPDMPVVIARTEWASLARLATKQFAALHKIGITRDQVAHMALFARSLKTRERAWQKAHLGSVRSGADRKRIAQAEALKKKLLDAGDWACRRDDDARAELAHIREGSGIADLVQDLRDLHEFWSTRMALLATTRATPRDVALAPELADALDEATTESGANTDGADALELRNRCFWAGDALASELRSAGRYAFSERPKLAAKFVSRYRVAKQHAHRARKSGVSPASSTPATPQADTSKRGAK